MYFKMEFALDSVEDLKKVALDFIEKKITFTADPVIPSIQVKTFSTITVQKVLQFMKNCNQYIKDVFVETKITYELLTRIPTAKGLTELFINYEEEDVEIAAKSVEPIIELFEYAFIVE